MARVGRWAGRNRKQNDAPPFARSAPPLSKRWDEQRVREHGFGGAGLAQRARVGASLHSVENPSTKYEYDPTYVSVLSGDPNYANVKPLVVGGLNPNKELKGDNESHLDAWVGYSRKLSHNINWRIQMNLRNVGEKDRLFVSQRNPDGSLALARIQQGMTWQISNSFEF